MNKPVDTQLNNNSDRVIFEYEVECDGISRRIQPRFVIGILADLKGYGEDSSPLLLNDQRFLEINADNFDDRIAGLQPGVLLPGFVHDEESAAEIHLSFDSLDSFGPVSIARRTEGLREPMQKRQQLAELHDKLRANRDLTQQIEDLLDTNSESLISWLRQTETDMDSASFEESSTRPQALSTTQLANIDQSTQRAIELLRLIAVERNEGYLAVGTDLVKALDQRLTQLDAWIAQRVDYIIHHPDFLRLEAAWRGIHYLVSHIEFGKEMKLRIFPASLAELTQDLQHTKQVLTSKLYTEEFCVFGGEPYGLIVADYAFCHLQGEPALLSCLAKIGSICSCPVLGGVSPVLLNCASLAELTHISRLGRLFDLPEYSEWRTFRQQPEASYIGLALPRVLGRDLHLEAGDRPDRFAYEETIDDTEAWPWINAVYPLAERIAQTYLDHGWLATVADPESGGRITDLPTWDFITDTGDFAFCCPTEMPFTQLMAEQLNRMGLIVLRHQADRDEACFNALPSLYDKAAESGLRSDTSDDLVTCMLLSPIVRALLYYRRDRLMHLKSNDQIRSSLNAWLRNYVYNRKEDTPTPETPLANAGLEQLSDSNQSLGAFRLWVRPAYQVGSPVILSKELQL